jgi:hypothetical protein
MVCRVRIAEVITRRMLLSAQYVNAASGRPQSQPSSILQQFFDFGWWSAAGNLCLFRRLI